MSRANSFIVVVAAAFFKEFIIDLRAILFSSKYLDSIKDVIVTLAGFPLAEYVYKKIRKKQNRNKRKKIRFNRWIAIGDIHGQGSLIDKMLAYMSDKEMTEDTQVIFLGDLLNRSPSLAECELLFNRILNFKEQYPNQCVFLLGNHELNYLRTTSGKKDEIRESQGWELKVYAKHREFISQFLSHYETEEYFFSHAGGLLKNGSFARNAKTEENEDALFWNYTLPQMSPKLLYDKTIVRGHAIVSQKNVFQGQLVSADLGAFQTGLLGAVILPERALIIAKKNEKEIEKIKSQN